MSSSLILFAHGARDPEWAQPLVRLQQAILAREPQRIVKLAFLEFMAPTLAEAIDAAVAEGCSAVTVVPVFLAQGGHVKRDLPLIVEAAQVRHPGVALTLRPAIGETQAVIDAMAGAILAEGWGWAGE